MLSPKRSLRTDFFRFASSTVASQAVFSIYAIVDGMMVARGCGEYAMSAVNLSVPLINALFSISVLFAVGTSTLIAIFLAQKRPDEANVLFSQNLTVLLLLGLSITLAVFLFLKPFALFLGADELTLPYTLDYLKGLAPFSLFFLLSYNLEILVRTDGYPRFAIITAIGSCLLNCMLDYVAIFRLGMGTFGAALATGMSQAFGFTVFALHFFGKKCSFHLCRFRFDLSIYRRLLPIGLPDGMTELCTGLMIFLFNRTILRCIGTNGIVAYTVTAYVNTLIVNLMVGISQGAQPLTSFHYGKGEHSACKTLLKYSLRTVCVMGPFVLGIAHFFAPQIVSAFLKEAEVSLIDPSVHAFRIYSLSFLLVGFNVVTGGFMTSLERPFPAISISLSRGLILQSAALLLASAMGGDFIWMTPIFSESLTLMISFFFLRRYLREVEAHSGTR